MGAPIPTGGQGAPEEAQPAQSPLAQRNQAITSGLLQRRRGRLSGLGDVLSTILGGQADPLLSEAQNTQAGRQARTIAGLNTIVASQESGATALGSLAQGALAGQEAGSAGRAQLLQQQQNEELGVIADRVRAGGGSEEEVLQAMLEHALRTGNSEAATNVREVLKSRVNQTRAPATPTQIVEIRQEDGTLQQAVINKGTGEVIATIGARFAKTEAFGSQFEASKPVKGEAFGLKGTVLGRVNKRSGLLELVMGPDGVTPARPRETQGEARGPLLVRMLGAAGEMAIDLGEAGVVENRFEQGLNIIGFRELTSDETQLMNRAVGQVSRIFVFLLSGVTARSDEVKAAIDLFKPLPGDKPKTKVFKLNQLKILMNTVNDLQGVNLDEGAQQFIVEDIILRTRNMQTEANRMNSDPTDTGLSGVFDEFGTEIADPAASNALDRAFTQNREGR